MQQTYLIVSICIVCGLGVFCLIIIAVRCYASCRVDEGSQAVRSVNEIYAREIQVNEDQLRWEKVFQEEQEVTKIRDKQCSVCLENQVNTVTACSHYFHINCLIEWKKRLRIDCPYCKAKNLQDLTFSCHQCHQFKLKYHFQPPMVDHGVHMIPTYFLNFLSTPKKLLCPQCKKGSFSQPNNPQTSEQKQTKKFSSTGVSILIKPKPQSLTTLQSSTAFTNQCQQANTMSAQGLIKSGIE